MKKRNQLSMIIMLGVFCGFGSSPVSAQSDADREAIVQTALDYLEGWYQGNPERMARALHDDLAKRIAMPDEGGGRTLQHMGKEVLVQATARNQGQTDVDLRDNIEILDVFGHAAVVRADADDWVDFLQLAKFNGRWMIVNVLWELR